MTNLPAAGDQIPMPSVPGLTPQMSEEALWLARVWQAVRHHWLLIAAGTVVGIGLAAFLTARATPVYEATASLQIQDKQPNLPEVFKTLSTSGAEINTDMEVLRSRALVDMASSALGLRVRVLFPRKVARATLFSTVEVDDSAPAGRYRFQLQDDDRYAVTDATDGTPVGFASPGTPMVFRGTRLALDAKAPRYSVILVDVAPTARTVDLVQRALRIDQASLGADVVTLTYQDTDPILVRQVPNMVMARFMARRQDALQAEARATANFLRGQLGTVSAQLAAAEDTLRGFRERERVIDPQTEASSQVSRLVSKESERSSLEAERVAFGQTLEQVTTAAANREPGTPSPYRQLLAFPTLLRNQAATALLSSLDNVENERTALLVRRTMDDPDVKVLSNRIGEIEEQLHGLAVTYLDGLTNQVSSLDTALSDFKRELSTLPRKEVSFSRLERKTKGLEDVYTLLQTRLKEAEIQQGVTDPSVQVVDSAVTPLRPTRPRRGLNLLEGLLGGLMLGCLVAFLRESGDKSIRSRQDIMAATGLPVLGLVPEIRQPSGRIALVTSGARYVTPWRAEAPKLPPPPPETPASKPGPRRRYTFFDVSSEEPEVAQPEPARTPPAPEDLRPILRVSMSVPGRAAAEAYATLQTNIVFSRTDRAVKVLVVTSALPGDGKTTCATNLALTLTQRGIKTLVIDADLRRGVINRAFDAPLEPGLANVLMGTARLEAALRKMEVGETRSLMYYLTAGTRADNPTGLIESARMRSLIGELSTEYDRIIIDTPPVNAVTDAALLGSWADGVILIARAGVTERPALAYAVDQLRRVRAPLLGVVLNAIDFRRDAAYDNAYRYYNSEEYLNAAAE